MLLNSKRIIIHIGLGIRFSGEMHFSFSQAPLKAMVYFI